MILRLLARRRTGRRTAIPAQTVETPRRSSVNLFKGHTTSVEHVSHSGPRRAGIGAHEPVRVDHRRDAHRELVDEPGALLGRGAIAERRPWRGTF